MGAVATTKARRALNRGLACLLFGVTFALPVTGTVGAQMVNLALGLAGYRYGGVRLYTV